MLRFAIPVLGLLLLPAGTTIAPAAETHAQDGAGFRLVSEPPGPNGRWRAALLVDLEPGWKTYWLDPGEAGIPPVLDFSKSTGISSVKAHFPSPHRSDDGFSESIIYSEPFAVAIEGTTEAAPRLDLLLTIGLCREVCIPASVELKAEDKGEAKEIDAAFAALPKPSGSSEGIAAMRLSADGRNLEVTVRPAALGKDADLFVAAKGWAFGKPSGTAEEVEGGALIRLPVLRKPRKPASQAPEAQAVLTKNGTSWRATSSLPLPLSQGILSSGPTIEKGPANP